MTVGAYKSESTHMKGTGAATRGQHEQNGHDEDLDERAVLYESQLARLPPSMYLDGVLRL
jgi:hypothetical protein